MTAPALELTLEEDLPAFEARASSILAEIAGSDLGAELRIQSHSSTPVRALQRLLRTLHDAGLSGLDVPREFGGQGLGARHEQALNRLLDHLNLPTDGLIVHRRVCVPTLLQWASPEQRSTYVPAMLQGDHWFCQLFSEPDAGSDLANIRTRADRRPDGWRLSGSKVWTSHAHLASHGLCIARTDWDASKHDGLSAFIVDLAQPGITIQPLRQITGDSDFNEVFFDDVHLPADALVGAVGDGWRVVHTMLMHERLGLGARSEKMFEGLAEGLAELAVAKDRNGDPGLRQEIAGVYCCQRVLGWLGQRTRAGEDGGAPGPEGSLMKLGLARLAHERAAVAMRIAGASSQAWDGDGGGQEAFASLEAFALSIAGGTSEIQRNIIAERLLGLPRDPDPTRSGPFRKSSPVR